MDEFEILTKRLTKSREILRSSYRKTKVDGEISNENVSRDYNESFEIASLPKIKPDISVPSHLSFGKAHKFSESKLIEDPRKFKTKEQFSQIDSPKIVQFCSVTQVRSVYKTRNRTQLHQPNLQAVKVASRPIPETLIEPNSEKLDLPVSTRIYDNLSFKKYCTDPFYKTELISRMKTDLQSSYPILLCSPFISSTPTSENLNDSSVSNDNKRESKQLLKTLFCSIMHHSGHDIVPPILEQRIQVEMLILPRILAPALP